MRLKITTTLLAVLLLSSLALAIPVAAAPGSATCAWLSDAEWNEARSESFAILYLEGQASKALLAGLPAGHLDIEYTRFQAVFGTPLNIPLTIRIYSDEQAFNCLNSSAPPLAPGAAHSRVGEREIALIADKLLAYPAAWQLVALDILRYELGVLFASQLSAGAAPPGLLAAIGHYTQEPAATLGSLQLSPPDWDAPQTGFRELWETPEGGLDLHGRLLATSTVAFLIDQYGWNTFLEFVKNLATSNSPSASMESNYGQDMASLENEWRSYLPSYFQGRWRANVLYNLDLSPYEELLKSDQYAEAARQLGEILPFLEGSGQVDNWRRAVNLVERARRGNEAEKMVSEAQAAFGAGDYARAAELVSAAERSFAGIGNYTRADELHAFRNQMQKILDLHAELDSLELSLAGGYGGWRTNSRLVELDRRLSRLGDAPGQLRVRQLAKEVQTGQYQFQMLAGMAVIALVLALLGTRIWLLRRPPAPEAQL